MASHAAVRTHRRSWLRVRAVLAGGLVLGIGSAVTLAAWNDAEYASATLTAGTFGIVGSIDGTTFADHATAPGATIGFSVPASAMIPGSVIYGRFVVKTAASSVAGSLTVTATSVMTGATNLGPYLTYGAKLLPTGTACNATSYAASSTVAVAAGSALTVGDSTPRSLSANGANDVNYCFAITLPSTADNAAQGKSVLASWQFTATT